MYWGWWLKKVINFLRKKVHPQRKCWLCPWYRAQSVGDFIAQLSSAQHEAVKTRTELDQESSARRTLQLQLESKEQLIAGLMAQLETRSIYHHHAPTTSSSDDLSFSHFCTSLKDSAMLVSWLITELSSMTWLKRGTKPWQQVAVRWFVLYNTERNSPSFQPILRDFKVIYLKNLLTFKYRQFSLIPLSMVVACSARMANFLRGYD